jgi:hypothetical protein
MMNIQVSTRGGYTGGEYTEEERIVTLKITVSISKKPVSMS